MNPAVKHMTREVILENKLDTEEKYMRFRRSHPELNLPTAKTILSAYNAVHGKQLVVGMTAHGQREHPPSRVEMVSRKLR
jgi:hypothetical protein